MSGSPLGAAPTVLEEPDNFPYVRTRRMTQQGWLLDGLIRQLGVDWDQGRSRYTMYPIGLDAEPDFARVRERVRKFADIEREFATAAARREGLSEAAEADGRSIEAREHALTASILWGNAQWPLFGNSSRNLAYDTRKLACFERYMRHAAHPVVRVEVPLADGSLPGYLHMPTTGQAPWPCLVQIGGMDSFKEHQVAMYGDKFLERGIARLAVELPGQGEALCRGLLATQESAIEAGQAIIAWVRERPELAGAPVALAGNSFGSFWATQIASAVEGLAGCAVVGVIHQPGMRDIFETASPTFKARFMYMSGYTDEDAFDEFAAGLDLRPLAGRISAPYLVLAGEDDELSPLEHTRDLLARMPAPRELVVYQAERHSIGAGPAAAFGPNRHHLVADWILDRLVGRPAVNRSRYVDTTGRVHERTPDWGNDPEGPTR